MQKEKASGISDEKKVVVRTFGNFDITVNGEPVHFKRAKSKELLAYLIDRQGAGVSRAEAFAVLWEDRLYDYPMQKQLDVIIRSLHSTLKEYGIEDIFQLKNRVLRVNTNLFECDLYRYLKGDPEAVASFRGDYMQNYYWASITEAYINTYNKDNFSA